MGKKIVAAGSKKVMVVKGEQTINQAEALRKSLIKALIDADHVEMDMEKVTAVDLSFLQLLCSAHRTAMRLNKRLTLTGSRPEVFTQAVEAAGYARVTGCGRDHGKSCLWALPNHG